MSRSRDVGTRAETAVVRYLRSELAARPLIIERLALSGAHDRGDVAGVPDTVIQVKAARRIEPAAFLDAARVQASNAQASVYAAWIKRRGTTDPARWYALTDGEVFARLLDLHVATLRSEQVPYA